METRSSPSMRELRVIAHERGLKYYLHLSKPELFALLQSKQGGGAGVVIGTTATTVLSVPTSAAAANTGKPTAKGAAKTSEDRSDDKRAESRTADVVVASQPGCDGSKCLSAKCATSKVCGTRSSLRLLKRKASNEDEHADKEQEQPAKKAKIGINTLDPIMMTELGPHTFEFERTNGSIVVYNVDTLVQYILATGDFTEPQTRIPFSEENLRRIDYEAKVAKLNLKSVWEAKNNKHKFEEQKVKRDGILGLERCAGEYVTKMLDVVESDDSEEGEMMLIMSLFPSFSDIFEQIRASDKEYAKHCMNHFKAYLQGPKNRPTEDNSGLLPVILGFLDEVSKGGQSASAFGF
uniref:Uncharacterized protein n=1 Tax=Globisporangium ultimum (strain ATCC 200006 / CBS 805.95 / DAOM BR144) TaxID=431595 RepID=K3WA07_GLOUD